MPGHDATPDTADLSEEIPEIIDGDDGDEEDEVPSVDDGDNGEDDGEASTSSSVFSSPHQVFIVTSLSKAISGFRPSVMCEGRLVELTRTADGYAMEASTSGGPQPQQLSFKYEPPSPKFTRKHHGCLSYRLQLLSGSQFLTSLRGLPPVLRLQRDARAVEWGPVHVVFAHSTDMDAFVATLKYVEVEEGAPLWSPEAAALWLGAGGSSVQSRLSVPGARPGLLSSPYAVPVAVAAVVVAAGVAAYLAWGGTGSGSESGATSASRGIVKR